MIPYTCPVERESYKKTLEQVGIIHTLGIFKCVHPLTRAAERIFIGGGGAKTKKGTVMS